MNSDLNITINSAPVAEAKKSVPMPANFTDGFFYAACRADDGACGHLRSVFIDDIAADKYRNCCFFSSRDFIYDEFMLSRIGSYRVQRFITPEGLRFMREYLLPRSRKYGFRIIYDIDDLLINDAIPRFNVYRENFKDTEAVIRECMEIATDVTFSCERLKNHYRDAFSLPEGKLHIQPNYYPRFFADTFVPENVSNRIFNRKGRKPRIVFSSSRSHFDVCNQNGGEDDFSGIFDWIIENRHRYDFAIYGAGNKAQGIVRKWQKYAGEIELHEESPYAKYAAERRRDRADLYIQPLCDCEFNRCKSVIKHHEAWAAGVPVLTQGLVNYMESDPGSCFRDVDDLECKVEKLFADPEAEYALVESNYKRMDEQRLYLDDRIDEILTVMDK